MRKLIAGAVLALIVTSAGGTAFAGEITGGPNPKPNKGGDKAHSVCSFSGQEDGETLISEDPFVVDDENTLTGPGYVQTPHHENGAFNGDGIIHPAGIPGTACRGN
jgi:hypothetical protein